MFDIRTMMATGRLFVKVKRDGTEKIAPSKTASDSYRRHEQIRVLERQQASFLILMVLVTVAIIDAVSRRLRAALIGRRR